MMADVAIGALLGSALTVVVLATEIPTRVPQALLDPGPVFSPGVICEQDPIEHFVCTWARRKQP